MGPEGRVADTAGEGGGRDAGCEGAPGGAGVCATCDEEGDTEGEEEEGLGGAGACEACEEGGGEVRVGERAAPAGGLRLRRAAG